MVLSCKAEHSPLPSCPRWNSKPSTAGILREGERLGCACAEAVSPRPTLEDTWHCLGCHNACTLLMGCPASSLMDAP